MKLALKISQKVMLLVSVPMLLNIILIAGLGILLAQSEQENAAANKSREIVYHLNRVLTSLLMGEGGMTIAALSTKVGIKSVRASDVFKLEMQKLSELMADRPEELTTLREVAARYMANEKKFAELKDEIADTGDIGLIVYVAEAKNRLHEIILEMDKLAFAERKLEEYYPLVQQRRLAHIKMILLAGAGLNVLIALSCAALFNRSTGRRLQTLMDNSVRLSIGEPLLPAVGGEDEIARLDRLFHRMARELMESSRKERAIIENAVEVICSIDVDERIKAINPATIATWGYNPEELLGRRYSSIVAESDRNSTREQLRETIQGKGSILLENRVICKDTHLVSMLWSVHWSEEERSLFCVGRDITEQRALERMKQEFVTMVSHDLRTPLTSVGGTLTMLAEGIYDSSSDVGKKRIIDASINVERLINLVNDLLDIEKLEAGALSLAVETIDLKSAAEQALESVRGYADQQGVKLEQKLVDATVRADSGRLIQVMINLLSNAVKYSPKEGTVVLSVDTNSDQATVKVQDQGRGIPEELRSAIFERFKQVSQEDGKRGVGTGLGLAICKAIVEAHSGSIGVDSTVDAGSTFWFTIPLSHT